MPVQHVPIAAETCAEDEEAHEASAFHVDIVMGVGSREWGVGEKSRDQDSLAARSHSPLPTPHPLYSHPFVPYTSAHMALPKVSLTQKIFIGLALGVLVGWLWPEWGTALRPLSTLFLNLIKSIIAPLIFATLVIGIAGTGDVRQVGRIGFKALLYFEIVTTFALFIGLGAVNLTKPGVGVSLAGVHTEENKAVLADRAKKLSDEARAAALKGDSALAASKASEAADVVGKGLTAPDPPAK